jgi:hypothetical protein
MTETPSAESHYSAGGSPWVEPDPRGWSPYESAESRRVNTLIYNLEQANLRLRTQIDVFGRREVQLNQDIEHLQQRLRQTDLIKGSLMRAITQLRLQNKYLQTIVGQLFNVYCAGRVYSPRGGQRGMGVVIYEQDRLDPRFVEVIQNCLAKIPRIPRPGEAFNILLHRYHCLVAVYVMLTRLPSFSQGPVPPFILA